MIRKVYYTNNNDREYTIILINSTHWRLERLRGLEFRCQYHPTGWVSSHLQAQF